MIGILVQLAISWLLLYLIEKKNLSVLGFYPSQSRLISFLFHFLITALCCASGIFLRMYFGREEWRLNPELSYSLVLTALWWNLKSVLFEELAFRGALLYILIRRIGPIKAIAISSIAFGIYHWFSFEILGQPLQMTIVFLMTGLMGIVLAYGYAKTNSLYIPIAIHLGWNYTNISVFSNGPIGDGIFVPVEPVPNVHVSYFIYALVVYFPTIAALVVNFLLIRRRKNEGLVVEANQK